MIAACGSWLVFRKSREARVAETVLVRWPECSGRILSLAGHSCAVCWIWLASAGMCRFCVLCAQGGMAVPVCGAELRVDGRNVCQGWGYQRVLPVVNELCL